MRRMKMKSKMTDHNLGICFFFNYETVLRNSGTKRKINI